MDTLFSCLNVYGNSHWVAMVISIPDRTVKIFDSGSKPAEKDTRLTDAAEPFAKMVPYALWLFAPASRRPSVDQTAFTIECVWKGVPQAKSPYGDCGVYALKFLECLMLGVPFSRYYLKDTRMEEVRKNLAAAMYVETAGANESMHDPKFLAIAIDEATKDREERN